MVEVNQDTVSDWIVSRELEYYRFICDTLVFRFRDGRVKAIFKTAESYYSILAVLREHDLAPGEIV